MKHLCPLKGIQEGHACSMDVRPLILFYLSQHLGYLSIQRHSSPYAFCLMSTYSMINVHLPTSQVSIYQRPGLLNSRRTRHLPLSLFYDPTVLSQTLPTVLMDV